MNCILENKLIVIIRRDLLKIQLLIRLTIFVIKKNLFKNKLTSIYKNKSSSIVII